MKTKYLGLELSSPVIVGSSPYTSTVSGLVRCAENGAGAAVLKSIFEEQILHHAASLGRQSESYYGDAELYLQRYLGDNYKAEFLQLLSAPAPSARCRSSPASTAWVSTASGSTTPR